MRVKVQWIIDGLIEIDAESNEAAEAIADEKLRSFIAANPELTEVLGADALQCHAVIEAGSPKLSSNSEMVFSRSSLSFSISVIS